eukprot:11035760-Alexandrium_andersonii.AAC.1
MRGGSLPSCRASRSWQQARSACRCRRARLRAAVSAGRRRRGGSIANRPEGGRAGRARVSGPAKAFPQRAGGLVC